MPSKSHWMTRLSIPKFPELTHNVAVDVVVIGGGITGITAAYLLKKSGRTVALLERDRFGRADTGHTTAHLSYVTDERLQDLVATFGRDHAAASWDAGRAAIRQIQTIVEENAIDCSYESVPGYLHVSWKDADEKAIESLRKDAELAKDLGFDAVFQDRVELVNRPGVRFDGQARFHPLKYLAGLLPLIDGDGSFVFENSEVEEFADDTCNVHANGHVIHAGYVVLATHMPLMGKTGMVRAALFQSKLTAYSSYAIAAQVPKGKIPDGLFWDTTDPYYYLRLEPGSRFDSVIFGGEDHKTGQEKDPSGCFARLEEVLHSIVPEAKVKNSWSGQVIESPDGLPYIGETAERQFAATAFAGNGMTFGTLAAMMAADAVAKRKNPWSDLFDVRRKKLAGVWDYVKENIDYPYYYLKDKLRAADGDSLRELARGEGKILELDGAKVAAYRSQGGAVTKLSPACTHMGCNVNWNTAESTWDCPCHGSRFHPTGEVLAGPAETPLPPAKRDGE